MGTYITVFREQSLRQLKELKPEKVQLFNDDSIEENYTLIIRPPENVINTINIFISQIRQIDPNQYYYPTSQLHLTLLGSLPSSLDKTKIISTVESLLPRYPMEFDLWGCGSNEYCASVSAYPSIALYNLRQDLRKSIGNKGDNYSIHLPLYEYVGWINFMRYLKKPSRKLLELLIEARDKHFGRMKVSEIEIYKNSSKTLNPEKITLIDKVPVIK